MFSVIAMFARLETGHGHTTDVSSALGSGAPVWPSTNQRPSCSFQAAASTNGRPGSRFPPAAAPSVRGSAHLKYRLKLNTAPAPSHPTFPSLPLADRHQHLLFPGFLVKIINSAKLSRFELRFCRISFTVSIKPHFDWYSTDPATRLLSSPPRWPLANGLMLC